MPRPDHAHSSADAFDHVPPDVAADARAAYALRHRSLPDPDVWLHEAEVRGCRGEPRIFSAPDTQIRVEIRCKGEWLSGHVVPGGEAELHLWHLDGSLRLPTDDGGSFEIRNCPRGPISIRITARTGPVLATNWFRCPG